uniref:Mitochondrial adenine nucleotide transporter BTL3 n=1 Tax=Musa acuminata subsp. malaccensis TaxID=214687 RepID=A0A804L0Z0_MUSAM|nr:PREDICTED: probable mitochondrial adenine nucleotide transporter BTL3 [Musa acuminata subsp. malaccensis]
MHYHYQSPTTFNKYFPELRMATKDTPFVVEPPQDLLATPFSTSLWISKILHANLSGKSGSPSELKCFDVENITCLARIPPTLRFNHILRPESIAATIEEGNEEEEKYGSRKSDNSGLASEEGKGKGKGHWNDMHKFLLAGTVSTVISRTCVAPLERIKLECIVQGSKRPLVKIVQCIWTAEGLRGFWKGNALNLLRMVPFKSINFICYDMYLDWLLNSPGKKEITNHDRLVGGGISGLLATVICIPLDTIRTRLLAPGGDALGGVAGCVSHMVQNEGFLSLYKGLAAALISMGPASAVFYTVYDILKSSHLSETKKKRTELGPAWTLAYGAIAGACSETVTYPLEVIRRQLQLQQSTNLGLASAFIDLVKRGGAESLFAGLVPSTLQVLPSAALSYFFYEMMKSILKI